MDEDPEVAPDDQPIGWKEHYKRLFLLAYQSLGVVYGDLSTSPLYVYKGSFAGRLQHYIDEEIVFGIFSLIFWTFSLITLLKYVFIVLSADDNGEGGTFALYSLLCRHANFNLLPNQQAYDEKLSTYYLNGYVSRYAISSPFKRFMEKHKKLRTCLLLIVLLGVCMLIGDGVLTPAITVLSAVSGLQVQTKGLHDGEVLIIVCILLVGLFALQHIGTQRVAFLFAPVVTTWLLCIGIIGVYNIIHWNPRIYRAISPHYIIKFFSKTGKDGWVSLGGVLLSITGTEAVFADLGHFTGASIRVAFVGVVYPCLVLQYMGQAAFLSKHPSAVPDCFYQSIAKPVFWPVFAVGTLAAIIASQAIILATFSIVKQCHALGCFPRVKVVHTSRWVYGRIYIPEINWILMLLCLAVTIGYRNTTLIGHAYGVACMSVMLITTCLMALVIVFVWQKNVIFALSFLSFFGFIEGVYLSSSLMKIPQGGWVPLALSILFIMVMYIWHYGSRSRYQFDLENKVSMKWILTLGPSLGIARIPGIGLIYTELVSGVPVIFSHFITNFPAFHQVLVFVSVKSVPVPHVRQDERYLIGRIGPRTYRMYRCIVRYGYRDLQREDDNYFENHLVLSIAKFIKMEADESSFSSASFSSWERTMVVVRTPGASGSTLVMRDVVDQGTTSPPAPRSALPPHSLRSIYEMEAPSLSQSRPVHFELAETENIESEVREELLTLIEAQEAGVAYILGNTRIKARRTSSFMKKFAIDVVYNFLRRNSRGPAVALNIPHISLIEVGMIYYV